MFDDGIEMAGSGERKQRVDSLINAAPEWGIDLDRADSILL